VDLDGAADARRIADGRPVSRDLTEVFRLDRMP
jgi:hypothetical protein